MAEEHHHHHHHHLGDEKSHDECESTVISSTNTDEVEVETQDRGLFGFMGNKEEEKKPEEEVMVTEFEKVHVSEPEPKFEDCKEKEKKHDLLEKLPRSNSSSSSSSDEEYEDENGEKKKKKKNKGPIEKIKEKISGDKEEENIEKYEAVVTPLPPKEKYEEEVVVEHGELAQQEEKKGIFEKIKGKLPGQNKKAEEVPPPPPAAEYAAPAAETHSHEAEPKEKKGIFEKIKEKLPGYHSKTEEEKECASPTK
uniref:Dehydrin n=1 Tax=Camellia sinensis TaxID=4442 RepID=C6KID8_CAMSI|nr:dehydrin [Camellia sinensis]